MSSAGSFQRPMLVLAQPGHEIGVFGFLARHRPVVLGWTDGAGRGRWPRAEASRAVLRAAGAEAIEPFGTASEARLYSALLNGESAPFLEFLERLREQIRTLAITDVVTEAAEGFNPLVDLVRAAVALAAGSATVWEWTNASDPVSVIPVRGVGFDLTEFEFHRKLQATHSCIDLAPEIDRAMARQGPDRFRREVFARGLKWDSPPLAISPPWYERRGAELLAAGHVRRAIRYSDHVRPMLQAMEAHAIGRSRAA